MPKRPDVGEDFQQKAAFEGLFFRTEILFINFGGRLNKQPHRDIKGDVE
jgi:hypothetical protein